MEQVKTFEHNQRATLDNLVNEFLKEISNKGYDLLEIYYNTVWNHNQNNREGRCSRRCWCLLCLAPR